MRLAGVKNEDNPINSVLEKMSHSEVKFGDIVQTKQGIVSGADKLTDSHLAKYPSISGDKGTGIFTISKRELKDLNLTDFEMEYVFPFYKNSQISRYHTKTDNQIYIIYLTKYDDIEKLPNLNRHLIKYREILEKKRECREGKIPWYSLHWPRDKKLLQSEKIVNSRRAKFNTFAIERGECFEQSDIAFSVIKETFRNKTSIEYLLALLNSKLYYIWLYNKGKRKGDMLELYGTPLSEIPIWKKSK